MRIATSYIEKAPVVLYTGDCLDLLSRMPDGCAKLVVTSPPYNLSKKYEKKITLDEYVETQGAVIAECVRVLHRKGQMPAMTRLVHVFLDEVSCANAR